MRRKQKHNAEQLVSPIVDPPVRIKATVTLTGDVARLWRAYGSTHAEFRPSDAQLATAILTRGLTHWAKEKGL